MTSNLSYTLSHTLVHVTLEEYAKQTQGHASTLSKFIIDKSEAFFYTEVMSQGKSPKAIDKEREWLCA